jgi:tetratricopeptide (TPR) repeat protein
MLARMTYTDAIVWLITRITDGLAHAHARGILHLDLKPANVLFSDDGQPMLLDFNLGYDVCRQDRERIGGTWPYMAPEQIQEYAGEPGVSVDTRTDLYAIGILFFELLTCQQPFPPMARGSSGLSSAVAARWAALPSVRKLNPTVPPAIESVICKLLDPDPAKRYQSAEDLQTDLERHQSNLPLKFAHNPSVRELAKKWQRRHPKAITHTLLSACLISMIGLGLAALNLNNTRSKERAIRTSTELNEALAHLRTDLVSPNDTELRRAAIKTGKDWLTRYGLPVDQKWADVPLVKDLPDDKRYATATALGELAALMAHAEMLDGQTTNTPVREAARRAAKWNRAAEQWFATANIPAIIWEQRAAIATTAEDLELAATIPEFRPNSNTTRTDLLLRAATHIASGEYALAIAPLTRLTDRENNLFAAHLWLAYCYQKTSKHLQALERYQMARALAPQDYRVPYNRGLVLLHLNRDHEAEDEFTQALKRNAQHADSYWHRALARRRLGDTRGAIDDLTYGIEIGVPRLSALLIRAELYRKLGDLAAESADRAAAENVQPQQEREFITRGLLRMRKDPLSALADFERAIELNPSSLTGWQNKGAVLSEYLGRTDEGLAATAKAVELHPEYGPVRMNLAVLLARLGHRSDAHREASRALMFSKDPQVIYQAANVYALTSASNPEDQEIAITYLRQALQEKFDKFSLIDQDPDMANIRHLPAFSQAIQAARELHAK